MAKTCFFSGKGSQRGMKVSHSHRRSPRVLSPNLQRRKVTINGVTKHVWVSTRFIKAGKLQPYLSK